MVERASELLKRDTLPGRPDCEGLCLMSSRKLWSESANATSCPRSLDSLQRSSKWRLIMHEHLPFGASRWAATKSHAPCLLVDSKRFDCGATSGVDGRLCLGSLLCLLAALAARCRAFRAASNELRFSEADGVCCKCCSPSGIVSGAFRRLPLSS